MLLPPPTRYHKNNKGWIAWHKAEETELAQLLAQGWSVKRIAQEFTRSESSIRSRMRLLGLRSQRVWPGVVRELRRSPEFQVLALRLLGEAGGQFGLTPVLAARALLAVAQDLAAPAPETGAPLAQTGT